jgi:hypothetical protein
MLDKETELFLNTLGGEIDLKYKLVLIPIEIYNTIQSEIKQLKKSKTKEEEKYYLEETKISKELSQLITYYEREEDELLDQKSKLLQTKKLLEHELNTVKEKSIEETLKQKQSQLNLEQNDNIKMKEHLSNLIQKENELITNKNQLLQAKQDLISNISKCKKLEEESKKEKEKNKLIKKAQNTKLSKLEKYFCPNYKSCQNYKSVLTEPCNHFIYCAQCYQNLPAPLKECPICKHYIINCIRTTWP